ncbi:Fc receptor-like protein 5 isoform X2 [Micropterus salmoides]|uniref:Fc receptor-like protein 5 isoform X2 n=1 Tax=Micropterus salmoides TaxID=27706 RepID=UPI0018EE1F6F|nr:Fc receptor-like protein 5 isoform X2 [Micropterus salmoides]
MQLTPFCLVLSCLQVSPDRSQFFRYESISLSCKDQMNSTGWKVKRKTSKGGVRPCSSGWGTALSGSTCLIGNTYPSDSGVYWCESLNGERSNGVNITITDRTVVLESPALPVSEGAAVTLRCKAEKKNSTDHRFIFYKDDRSISTNSTGEMTIHGASKSDEGLYKCSISGGGESLFTWLAVDASLPPSSSAPMATSSSDSVFRLMCHLVVGIPYMLSTVLLGLIYRDRKRAQMVAERRGSDDVIMEIVV